MSAVQPLDLQEKPMSAIALDRPGSARPLDPASRLAAPGQSFLRLLRTELRKSLDTRSGRWVLLALLLLCAASLGWDVLHAASEDVSFTRYLGHAQQPLMMLLPVIGILAMTSEWSQRTALTTFTLSPRRLRVLVAKMVAALVIALAVVAVVVVGAIAATGLASLFTDSRVSYDWSVRQAGGLVVAHLLNVLMGVSFGALLPVTAVALVAFFVAPTLFTVLSATVLSSFGQWLDVFSAFERVSELDGAHLGWTATALVAWVVVPTAIGLVLSNRREAK
jgi:ABC-type transport system involved in multi-copper enzyme maturation permease subunit